jgi:hypothetical protein
MIPAIDVVTHEKKMLPRVEVLRPHKFALLIRDRMESSGLLEEIEKVVQLPVNVANNEDRGRQQKFLLS